MRSNFYPKVKPERLAHAGSHFVEAVAAINRAVMSGSNGTVVSLPQLAHTTGYCTRLRLRSRGARSRLPKLLPALLLPEVSGASAIGTTAWRINQPFLRIKLLFARSPVKFVTALAARQCLVHKGHCGASLKWFLAK